MATPDELDALPLSQHRAGIAQALNQDPDAFAGITLSDDEAAELLGVEPPAPAPSAASDTASDAVADGRRFRCLRAALKGDRVYTLSRAARKARPWALRLAGTAVAQSQSGVVVECGREYLDNPLRTAVRASHASQAAAMTAVAFCSDSRRSEIGQHAAEEEPCLRTSTSVLQRIISFWEERVVSIAKF